MRDPPNLHSQEWVRRLVYCLPLPVIAILLAVHISSSATPHASVARFLSDDARLDKDDATESANAANQSDEVSHRHNATAVSPGTSRKQQREASEAVGPNSQTSKRQDVSAVEPAANAGGQIAIHALDVYNSSGWNFERDWVSKIIKPETLQPFYAMPIFFGIKLMMTLLIFGFSLKFRTVQPNALTRWLVNPIVKPLASLAFIALALNGMYLDHRDFQQSVLHAKTPWERVAVFLCTWVTSPNYIAAHAVWRQIIIESPMSLLAVSSPRYTAISVPMQGFPLCPGSARWLGFFKHIYAYVLAPYFLPSYIFKWALGMILFALNLKTGFVCVIGYCKCFLVTFGTCVVTVFSICLLAGPRTVFFYQFMLGAPQIYVVFILIWSAFLVPVIFASLYGVALYIKWRGQFDLRDELGRGIKTMLAFMVDSLSSGATKQESMGEVKGIWDTRANTGLSLTTDDIAALRSLNAEDLCIDFEDVQPDEGFKPLQVQSLPEAQLEDSKIATFGATLFMMSTITIEQLSVLFLLRASMATTWEEFMSCLYLTVMERRAQIYMTHMHGLARHSAPRAWNMIWLLV